MSEASNPTVRLVQIFFPKSGNASFLIATKNPNERKEMNEQLIRKNGAGS